MPKLKIVEAPPDRSPVSTALVKSQRLAEGRKGRDQCKEELENGRPCTWPAIRGTQYCAHHTRGERPIKGASLHQYTRTPQVMDVFNAYTDGMKDEDREFMLSVYGDWNLDPEIALLRLAIKDLLTQSGTEQKLNHLPRLVQSLTAAIREAVGMVEGSKMIVDFGSKAGRTYWKELFRAFQSMVEELHTQLCPVCQETIQNFVHGGTENVPQFSVIDINATESS